MNIIKIVYVGLFLFLSSQVANSALVEDYYNVSGPTESLIARFDHSIEATTNELYSGLVLFEISNFGWNNTAEAFDGFYFFVNSNWGTIWEPRKSNSLRIAFDGDTYLSGISFPIFDDDPLNPAGVFDMVFNEDIGHCLDINENCIPEYNASHDYRVVLDFGGPSRILNFGFGDGGLGDNSGQFDINITPLTEKTVVPLPSSIILFTSGLLFLTSRRRLK